MSDEQTLRNISLPLSAVDRLMPFHLIIDESAVVVSVGNSINELFADSQLLGAKIFDKLTVRSHSYLKSYQQCYANTERKIRIRNLSEQPVELWGELTLLDQPKNHILFDLLPTLGSHAHGRISELKKNHYPAADLTNELLTLVEMQRSILDRANHLNIELAEQTHETNRRADLLSSTLELLTSSLEASHWTLSFVDSKNKQSLCNIGYKTNGHIHALLESEIFLAEDIIEWIENLHPENAISVLGLYQSDADQFTIEITDNNEHFWTLAGTTLDSGGRSLICIDVSKFKLQEKRRALRERMESLGRLTNGVAHDFNNLLAIISCGLETLETTTGRDQHTVELINEAVSRATKLVRQLVDYVKQPSTNVIPTPLSSTINNLVGMSGLALGGKHRLEIESDNHLAILCDSDSLNAALLNLIINARDAMVDGGIIKVVTRQSEKEENKEHKLSNQNTYAAIDIIDEGIGIDHEIRDNIYEPFFSTKRRDSGSGLGLSIVYNFATGIGGAITHRVNRPTGTIMTLFVPAQMIEPALKSPAIESSTSPASPLSNQFQNIRVLLIEDENSLAEIISAQLKFVGITCQTLYSVSALREYFASDADKSCDIVITDYYLSDGTAEDVIGLCKKHTKPEGFIIMSGNHLVMQDACESHTFLPKPFSLSQLVEAVNSQLQTNH